MVSAFTPELHIFFLRRGQPLSYFAFATPLPIFSILSTDAATSLTWITLIFERFLRQAIAIAAASFRLSAIDDAYADIFFGLRLSNMAADARRFSFSFFHTLAFQ